MSKKIKALFYGEPGVGKSVFACQFPKPFFLTTDGNYEWLEDFGAKPEAHHRVDSWADFVDFINKNDFEGYDTIVVDLLEDLFKWNEYEFVQKNKLDHVSDAGYGKGYDITRNDFFIEVTKLLNKDKNIILLMHEITVTTKDRRGVEKNSYRPSNRLPDKVLDMVEGRLRFVLRAYFQDVDINGRLVQKRMLSLIPKSNEYGIIRGVNTDALPEDIPLSVSEFFNVLNNYKVNIISTSTPVTKQKEETSEEKKEEALPEPEKEVREPSEKRRRRRQTEEVSETPTPKTVEPESVEKPEGEEKLAVGQKPTIEEKSTAVEKPAETPSSGPTSLKDDKLAAIKAKLAALKKKE